MPDVTYQSKVYRKQGGDELVVASGGTITVESGGAIALAAGASVLGGYAGSVRTSTENTYVLTAAMSGLVYVGTKTSATQVIDLPAPTTAGLVFTFVCGHADGEININPGASTYTIKGISISVAAGKDLKNTAGSNAVGDTVTLISDGVSNWWIIQMQGTWAST